MSRISSPVLTGIIILTILLTGCTGNPSTPGSTPQDISNFTTSDTVSQCHQSLGYSFITIDPENLTIDIEPLRTTDLHVNIVSILNMTMGVAAAGVPAQHEPLNGIFVFDITLTHPFGTKPQLAGFDVKGILITPGSLNIGPLAFADVDETQLLNSDGYTRWWNPTEFTSPGMFGYTQGALANAGPVALTATVNPYKYFADALIAQTEMTVIQSGDMLADNGRGVFTAGSSNTRRYRIQFPMTPGPQVVYGYAVDASWAPPFPNPPAEIPDDFPIAANQPEAYDLVLHPTVNTLYFDSEADNGGGVLRLQVNVHDWQGQNVGDIDPQVESVRIYAPDLFEGGRSASYLSGTTGKARYSIDLYGTAIPESTGEVLIAAKVVSSDGSNYTQGAAPAPDATVSAWETYTIEIPDPDCAGDANNDFTEAVPIGIGNGVEDQVCLPDDYRDFYSFTIPAVFAAEGSIDLYCDTEPTTLGVYDSDKELMFEESVSAGIVSISTENVTLFPGDYYIRVFTSNDMQVSPYYLEMNIDLIDRSPSPVEITPDDLYCEPHRSFIHENYLISLGYHGLWIYDITNTASPNLIYHDYESYGSVLEFNWPYIYYADYQSSPDLYDLSLIDLTNIADPEFHYSVIVVGDNIKYITMNSEHLYMVYEISDVRQLGIYDWATDPLSPAQLYSSSVPACEGFWVGLSLLHPETESTRLLVWQDDTVQLWDVEDPETSVSWLSSYSVDGNIRDIKTYYSLFYIVDSDLGAGAFTTCQVQTDSIIFKGVVGISDSPYCLDIAGDYAYVGTEYGIDVIDKSDSTDPIFETSLPAETYVIHLYIDGARLVTTPVYTGFSLFSISYPQLPDLLYNSPVINDPMHLELVGDYMLVVDDDYNVYHSIKVLDVSDPADPAIVEEFTVSNSNMSGIVYHDGVAYVGDGWDLLVIDCSDMLDLSPIGTIDLADNIGSFVVYRDTLYLGATNDHIYVYDVTNQTAPEYKVTKDSTNVILDFAFNGDYMYTVNNGGSIEIFSVANPWNPTSQGTYTPGEEPSGVISQDDYLYVACDTTFEILNIANPIVPVYEGSVLGGLYDEYMNTATDGLYAYVGGGWQHFCTPMISSLWPPDSPSIAYSFDPWTYGTPSDIEVDGDILYIATSNGLRIFDLY